MDVEKLTLELRPRPHWQAIDLGFALLRSRARSVMAAWWAVWSGIVLVACAGAFWKPEWETAWMLLPWALRPAVERIVVHILSRGVFGEVVTWKQAVRAWPSTLTRDLWHVMTWWRFWALGRSFLQPVWQLEGVTGSVASRRREALSRKGAGRTAGAWGLACVHLEMVLWVAVLSFWSLFFNAAGDFNPFNFLSDSLDGLSTSFHAVVATLSYGMVLGFVGPFYAACGFTLYLNRRAELEAWDIELSLRTLARRKMSEPSKHPAVPSISPVLLAVALFSVSLHAQTDSCAPPKWWSDPASARRSTTDPQRIELRRRIDSIHQASPRLRQWHCQETWVAKDTTKPVKEEPDSFWTELSKALDLVGKFLGTHAAFIQWGFISAAIALVLWIAWKYRDMVDLGGSASRDEGHVPTAHRRGALRKEEDLESDPTNSARELWTIGSRREALSLLYRLAVRESVRKGAVIRTGDSEGSVDRIIGDLLAQGILDRATHALMHESVDTWSRAAWAGIWPDTDSVNGLCDRWSIWLSKEPMP